MTDIKESPSQSAGPYVHLGYTLSAAGLAGIYDDADLEAIMITGTPEGQAIVRAITVIDGAGEPLFHTLRPKHSSTQAPDILVWIAARGINTALMVRIYFADAQNDADPVFTMAGKRASTLIATQIDGGYNNVINLQRERETVFFDV